MPANAVYNAFNLSNSTPAVPSGAGNQNVKWQNDASTPPNISAYTTNTPISPDSYPNPPNAANDEFDTGSSIDLAGTRFSGATPWSWLNQPATAAALLSNGYLQLFNPNAGANWNWSLLSQPQVGAAWEYQCKTRNGLTSTAAGVYGLTGLFIYNSGNGHIVLFNIIWYNGGPYSMAVFEYSSIGPPAVYVATVNTQTNIFAQLGFNEVPFIYLSPILASGTRTFRYSLDGVTWTPYPSTLALATYPGAVTHVGLVSGVFTSGAQTNTTVFDWFRRIS